MEELVGKKQKVYLRKINISNWETAVSDQYKITSIPNFRVFGPQKQQLGPPTSRLDAVVRLIGKVK